MFTSTLQVHRRSEASSSPNTAPAPDAIPVTSSTWQVLGILTFTLGRGSQLASSGERPGPRRRPRSLFLRLLSTPSRLGDRRRGDRRLHAVTSANGARVADSPRTA